MNFLFVILCAWFVAQLIKVALQRNLRVFVDVGGMPSAHSSLVGALVVAVFLKDGLNASSTAIACVLALIVVHDAVKVRRHHTLPEVIAGLLVGGIAAFMLSML